MVFRLLWLWTFYLSLFHQSTSHEHQRCFKNEGFSLSFLCLVCQLQENSHRSYLIQLFFFSFHSFYFFVFLTLNSFSSYSCSIYWVCVLFVFVFLCICKDGVGHHKWNLEESHWRFKDWRKGYCAQQILWDKHIFINDPWGHLLIGVLGSKSAISFFRIMKSDCPF